MTMGVRSACFSTPMSVVRVSPLSEHIHQELHTRIGDLSLVPILQFDLAVEQESHHKNELQDVVVVDFVLEVGVVGQAVCLPLGEGLGSGSWNSLPVKFETVVNCRYPPAFDLARRRSRCDVHLPFALDPGGIPFRVGVRLVADDRKQVLVIVVSGR